MLFLGGEELFPITPIDPFPEKAGSEIPIERIIVVIRTLFLYLTME